MQKWYDIKAKGGHAEVLIFGDIGESWNNESVTAKKFVQEFGAIIAPDITVRINSYGGSVIDAAAIYNAIRRHPARIKTTNDGAAVSAASLILMAGDIVEMAANSLIMIHAPWNIVSGNAEQLREYADVLDKYGEAMATGYAQKMGKTSDEVVATLLDGKDHWFSAEEALASGLIDVITSEIKIAASGDFRSMSARFSVPVSAGFFKQQNKVSPMEQPTNQQPDSAGNAPDNVVDIEQIKALARTEIQAAESERRKSINSLFQPAFMKLPGVSEMRDDCLADMNISAQLASDRLMKKLGESMEPTASKPAVISMGESESDKFSVAAHQTLMVRAGISDKETQAKDRQNNYRSFSLLDMARASLQMGGVNMSGKSKLEVVSAAFTHSTSDFTNLLANVSEKAMLKGYDEAEETFQRWTSTGSASDFKAIKRVDLNSFPSLAKVAEGAEYSYGTVGDRGETVQLATYGKMFSITRQAIINDDLAAFTTIPRRMGRAAIRTVGDLVMAVLTGNPVMSDAVALFHATHNNLLTAATISTASVDAMMAGMAKQKDASNNASALNINMAYLLVPYALRGLASQVANSEYEVGAANKNNTVPNYVRGMFEVIADARLDAASSTAWFGVASPNVTDTIEVTYLDGQSQPYLEAKDGWDIDGAEFKVRIDAAVTPLDFRTMAKNAGL